MSLINILIIGSSVVILLLLWMVVGVRHLRNLKANVFRQWVVLDEGIRQRHDLIPNLIETVRRFNKKQEKILKNFIRERRQAAVEYLPGAKKMEYEYDLTESFKRVFALEKSVKGLGQDVNFLELRTEVADLGKNLNEKLVGYNDLIRRYNAHRNKIVLRPLAWMFGYGMMDIFKAEVMG